MDELWNQKLTRENISDFYKSTVVMAYTSVLNIIKETARTEQVVMKSYIDVYTKRATIEGEDVIYVFGDVLLKNAQDMVQEFPAPENANFVAKNLDEYTGNFMLEKILTKIDSRGYKMAEFISSDAKKSKSTSQMRRISDLFPITPLLIMEIVIVGLVIWVVSYAAITVPYSKKSLVNEQKIFGKTSLQEQYVSVLQYFPLDIKYIAGNADSSSEEGGQAPATQATEDSVLAPSIADPTEPPVSATSG